MKIGIRQNFRGLIGILSVAILLIYHVAVMAESIRANCTLKWTISPHLLCRGDVKDCLLQPRISPDGYLFVMNSDADLAVFCPGNKCFKHYDLSAQLKSFSLSLADFVPLSKDLVVVLDGQVYQFDVKKQQLSVMPIQPNNGLSYCKSIDPGFGGRNLSQLGSSTHFVGCGSSVGSDIYGKTRRIFSIFTLDVMSDQLRTVEMFSEAMGENPYPPWLLVFAAQDGNIYVQSLQDYHAEIGRRGERDTTWQTINLAHKEDYLRGIILFNGVGSGDLIGVDDNSNLYVYNSYYNRSDNTSHTIFSKYTPHGNFLWAVTNEEMRLQSDWMRLLRVESDGSLLIWSENHSPYGNYEVHQCAVDINGKSDLF